jgi:hypothetical protein
MLGIRNKLVFPRLKWVGEGPIVKGDIDSRRGVYRLDWAEFDGVLRKKHENWNKSHWPSKDLPYKSVLPPEYDLALRDARFAINQSYEEEIKRNCRRSLIEWNIHRGFDTCVREMCLEPGQSHVWVAFKLINDCLYDADTRYFHRGSDKWFLANAMVYKFWGHQTGSGLLRRNARLEELGKRMLHDHISRDVRKPVLTFLDAVLAREEELDKESEEWRTVGVEELEDVVGFAVDSPAERSAKRKLSRESDNG